MKPGWKTTEFWMALVATMIAGLFASGTLGDGTILTQGIAAVAMALSAAGYATVRAWVKGADGKPGWKTSEFYLSLAAVVIGGLQASGLFADTGTVGVILAFGATILGALGYQVSRSFVKSPKK